MALVPLVDPEDFAEADRPALEQGRAGYGTVLHTWQGLATVPGLFEVYLPFIRKVAGPGQLDGVIKDLSAIRVTALNHCRYSLSHRWASGAGKAIDESTMRAVASGDYSGLDARGRAALELTEALTLLPPTVREHEMVHGVPEGVRAAAQAAFTPAELVELTMNIGLWNALTRFHRVMGFELDLPAAPADVADALL